MAFSVGDRSGLEVVLDVSQDVNSDVGTLRGVVGSCRLGDCTQGVRVGGDAEGRLGHECATVLDSRAKGYHTTTAPHYRHWEKNAYIIVSADGDARGPCIAIFPLTPSVIHSAVESSIWMRVATYWDTVVGRDSIVIYPFSDDPTYRL